MLVRYVLPGLGYLPSARLLFFDACAGALYSPSEHEVTSVWLLNAKNSFF